MTTEMFDSIDPSQIPAGQDAAGYVDGNWRTFTALHGPHNLSVAVFASDDADALDDEPGDATNAQAPGWVRRELSLGHWRPCVYTSASNVAALLTTLAAAGIARSQIRLWTAHYTYSPHLCTSACGLPAGATADATQWSDRSGGRNLDESTIADDFFNTSPAPATPAAAISRKEQPMPAACIIGPGLHEFTVDQTGRLVHRWYDTSAKPQPGWQHEILATGCDTGRGPLVTSFGGTTGYHVFADRPDGSQVHLWWTVGVSTSWGTETLQAA